MSTPLWQPGSDRAARLLGLGFLLFGAGLLWFQWHTIRSAVQRGETTIAQFPAAIAMGEMALTLGLLWVGGGLRAYTWVRALQEDKRRLWLTLSPLLLLILISILGLRSWLSAHGYEG
jgi:hypothetical protein